MSAARLVAVLVAVAMVLAGGCPTPPAPVQPVAPGADTARPSAEPVPPPVERPIPPERQGDVPEVPPPIKP